MKIIALGNGKSGLRVAESITKYTNCSDFLYIYEYAPHNHFDKFLKAHYSSIKNDLNELLLKAEIIIMCGWQYKIPKLITHLGNCYNIHPSLLPSYRGITSFDEQLKNNEMTFGITFHKANHIIDGGPIFKQISYSAIDEEDAFLKGLKCAEYLVKIFFHFYPNIKCHSQSKRNLRENVLIDWKELEFN